jgi:phosphoenolpyruvate carboxylase
MAPTSRHRETLETLGFLMRSFRAVLEDVGAADVAARLPWGAFGETEAQRAETSAEPFPAPIAERCVQAYSTSFQLLNTAEENAEVRRRRAAEGEGRLTDDPGSWDQVLDRAAALGASAAALADALERVRVEPVFTAHPTEAKRQTVLEHHRQLYRLLVELENTRWTATERAALVHEVEACLERLWRTGEIYLEKPSLADERRSVLHYLRHVFPDVVPRLHARLRAAWERAGHDLGVLDAREGGPRIELGNWVGGDRDGHPGVTAEVTTETLGLFRESVLELIEERLCGLAVRLSLSDQRQPPPPRLLARIEALGARLGDAGRGALPRNPGEPWRQHVNLLLAALPRAGAPRPGQFARASELLDELWVVRESLVAVGADRLARSNVDPVILIVEAFGFHLARVDVRQNSDFHDRALAHLLDIAGTPGGREYPEWHLPERRALLDAELATRRPFAARADVTGAEAVAVLDVYGRLADHRERFGGAGLGALIVSMTRSAEDLLAVHLLAREAGLLVDDGGARVCPLEVVPLFETIDDLERAPSILDDYLGHPVVAASLRFQQREQGLSEPVQQVMVGYSDSGKDGGITCSFWSLYRGQSRIAEVARRHGVRVRFFHGRGGTIGRGAGPTHRFVKALPAHTVECDLRVTEQGETIAQKYANPLTAAHHLELLAAGALWAAIADRGGRSDPAELTAIMDELSQRSRAAYRALLEAEGFVSFFERATPLDAIESSRIGSRPARRTGKRSLHDLRAIPWVFSWNQARFILPGWYGLGSALLGLRDADPARFERLVVAKHIETRWDPFHYLVSNAATALMTSDLAVMRRYAALVDDARVRTALMERIEGERARTQEALEALYGGPLADVRADVHEILALRHQALLPLHEHQVELLRRWRDLRRAGEERAAEVLLPELLLTVNAIASGLGSTG